MASSVPPSGRVSKQQLVRLLGEWRAHGSRQGSAGLAAGIKLLVLDGQIPPGTVLPAERELAEALGVSRTLVGTAWDLLRADGLIVSRRGSGSWTALPVPADRTWESLDEQPLDLARAAPEAVPGIAKAIDAVRSRFAAELAGHGYHDYGVDILRQRVAERYTARGLPTSPAEVLITNGAHHALALVLRTMTDPGDRVLVELPTYPNAIDAIKAAHAIPVAVPLAEDGWDHEGIEAALRQASPRLAHFIVDFHNPTGRRLDAEGRARLVSALRRARTPVVVDETLVELDLDGDPLDGPAPLPAFGGGMVMAVGSASKSHWGGLRLGWVRASEQVIRRIAAARHAYDLGSPVLEQLVLAELYADADPVPRERRAELAARRDALVEAVRTHCPQWTFEVPCGGLSLWCRLPEPIGTRLAVTAQNFGVRVAPGSRFAAHGGLERWLRLPYTLPPAQLAEAVRRLSLVAENVTGSPAPISPYGHIPVA
ncbi:DNA-binding transcriptional regulator, MocR family, contains an aminotransferase domain [Actinokineospora alba]|uniref:DNA-binding transcriptional regulator, MocR family, contains an aminotransferase domain n=1 Tax=Actinokineospora alba TaxID=504798 RepID=A0A1H0PEX9_9PSEU|nr:PLP-dependent aminotransferase family protein [Actinokineospora alba]TDP65769.1 GntR family transcriptional regulator [Actinokineospora alba]SDI65616.1 DNA-binding transcriptional regulator, MocR family, contains an aminotransferase domain [Actinokineospora alba]SDP03563.1 DNA-binding transcriptional regulator, MocR family, contains an aminotransferase domain [Actinokineospora alba]